MGTGNGPSEHHISHPVKGKWSRAAPPHSVKGTSNLNSCDGLQSSLPLGVGNAGIQGGWTKS